MKKRWKFQAVAFGATVVACLAFAGWTLSGQQACEAPDDWFVVGGPKPPDPNKDFTSLCAFHQWSWQSFLWLTQPEGDTLRFMNFATADAMFEKNPVPFAAARGARLRLTASLKNTEKRPPHSAINQAGSGAGEDSGILVHRNGRVVYFSIYVNEIFFRFVLDKQLNFYEKYRNADPKVNFPLEALELKAAWRIVEKGEPETGLFVTPALVDQLKPGQDTQGKPVIFVDTTAPPLEVRVALVGLHIAGVVKDHPEFLWATFEHNDNVPDLTANIKPADPVSNRDYAFYTANTARMKCNQFDFSQVKLDPATQKVSSPPSIARLNPSGGPTDQALVQGLNKSVHMKMKADSVWKNYDLIGTVWLPANTLVPNMAPNNPKNTAKPVGSTKLANSSMESFMQHMPNCFSCHDTRKQELKNDAGEVLSSLPPMNLNISHALAEPLLLQGARQAIHEGADSVGKKK